MSIRFNHATNKMTSTNTATITVEGGTPTTPRPLKLDASSVVIPNKQLPSGEAGAVVFDIASSSLKYHNGFTWVEMLSASDILAPVEISLTQIYNTLGTKVDSVSYSSSTIPTASISGTNLNIVFPNSTSGGGTDVPGLFTSLPTGSITHYSLTSGQSVASIREQMSGISGGQTGRNGTQALPFVTKTGWCFGDGLWWSWAGESGTVVRQVPNLNQNAYLKGITTSGITKTDAVIASSGTAAGTALSVDQLPSHNFTVSGTTSINGAHVHIVTYAPTDDGVTTGQTLPASGRNSPETANSYAISPSGDHNHQFTAVSNSLGGNQPHAHNLTNVDVTHFNVAILYNIAEPSTALNQTAGDSRYVLKSGDTMTGSLTIANSATIKADDTNLTMWFRNAAGAERAAIYHSSSSNTLRLRSNGGTEVSVNGSGLLTAPSLLVSGSAAVSGTLAVTGNGTVQGKNIVRSINGNNADTSGNVALTVTSTSASLGTNGWWKDENTGLIHQWGTQTSVGNGSFSVSFPISFTVVYNVSATRIGTTNSPTVAVNSITTTNFVIKQADGGDGGSYWYAIGV